MGNTIMQSVNEVDAERNTGMIYFLLTCLVKLSPCLTLIAPVHQSSTRWMKIKPVLLFI
ncbi:MAG: hypothetical protein VX467_05335 [Verrucomicrobiota bacterium]|nr:hypothetical protein [Verrucomicrobiota bacterium]